LAFTKISDYFNLSKNLEIGMLPLVLDSKVPLKTLNSYVGLYIQEEVKFEGFVRNIGNFSRSLETISFSQSSLLNISEVARESAVKRKTVENYIGILEDLMLSFRIPVFSKKAKRHLVKQSKFYFFDCGVYKSIRPSGPLDLPEEINGAALEGLVAQHLRAWIDYSDNKNKLFFWRTKSGTEVDFIVYGNEFTAIEVKHSNKNII
jgi:predicted AAA+ superfamily ATPase